MHQTEHSICLHCCTIYDTEACRCNEEVSCTQNVLLRFEFGPCSACADVLHNDQAIKGSTLVLGWAARAFVASGDDLTSFAVEAAVRMSTEGYYADSARFNFEQEVKKILRDLQPSRIDLRHWTWNNIAGKYNDDAWINHFMNFIIEIARKMTQRCHSHRQVPAVVVHNNHITAPFHTGARAPCHHHLLQLIHALLRPLPSQEVDRVRNGITKGVRRG